LHHDKPGLLHSNPELWIMAVVPAGPAEVSTLL